MLDHGRVSEAYKLLAPIYAGFTESFATEDLKDAKALLGGTRTCRRRACGRDGHPALRWVDAGTPGVGERSSPFSGG
jgi:hypothetical protein